MKKILILTTIFFASQLSGHHFIISTPKSGTHLIQKMTALILGKPVAVYDIPGQQYYTHHEVTESIDYIIVHPYPALDWYIDTNHPRLVVIRDIRDAIVSLYHFVEKHKYGPEGYDSLSKDDKIMYLINTDVPYMSLKLYAFSADRWIVNDKVKTIRFEDVVGVNGGGCRIKQRRSIKRLCEFLGVTRSEQSIDYVVENIFGGTMTFKHGKIGTWKEHFNHDHIEAFNHVYGNLMKKWGYY